MVCTAFSDSTIRVYSLWESTENELGQLANYDSSILNIVGNSGVVHLMNNVQLTPR